MPSIKDDIVRPIVTDITGKRYSVHSVDGWFENKSHMDAIENAKSPEGVVAAVRRAINEGVILYVKPFIGDRDPVWVQFAPQHIVNIMCYPFD